METDIESEYDTKSLIHYAIDQKPIDFEDAFTTLINDKLITAINNKKLEIASNLYANDENEEIEEYLETEEETSEDQENGETA